VAVKNRVLKQTGMDENTTNENKLAKAFATPKKSGEKASDPTKASDPQEHLAIMGVSFVGQITHTVLVGHEFQFQVRSDLVFNALTGC
jgi:hypothetical protein